MTSFADAREAALLDQSTDLHQRLGKLAEEQRRLVDIALQTFAAIQTGNVGPARAAGTALVSTLEKLGELIDRVLPEIRLLTGMTKTPPDAENPPDAEW